MALIKPIHTQIRPSANGGFGVQHTFAPGGVGDAQVAKSMGADPKDTNVHLVFPTKRSLIAHLNEIA